MDRFGEIISVEKLKSTDTKILVNNLKSFIKSLDLKVKVSQEMAWKDCIEYLKKTFEDTSEFNDLILVFEYWLPLSCYRRPDVLIFYKDMVLVLEFKRKNISLDVDKHQLRGYLNELRHFHDETHKNKETLEIKGCLVVTEAEDKTYHENGIDIIEGNGLMDFLHNFKVETMSDGEINKWLKSEYMPLIDVIRSTSKMFLNGEIPQIRNIEEGAISRTQEFLFENISSNHDRKKIFFLSGVPGAGKTLVLLNLIYQLNDFEKHKFIKALYTSGNGPLISTLVYILSENKDVLDGSTFIKDIKDIKSSIFNKYKNDVSESRQFPIICFDEAQRAWDLDHMKQYKFQVSEPELLLKLQNKAFSDYGYANLVCSYGDGQSIYFGEESGFEIWSEVLNKEEYSDWEVYYPAEFHNYFKGRPHSFKVEELYMNKSIRGNFVNIVPLINEILDVNTDAAKHLLKEIVANGFEIKLTKEFSKIRKYLNEYESESGDNFYGMVASSNSSLNTFNTMIPGFKKILSQKDNPRIGKWYVEDCNSLEEAAAEFGCQGLELNIPIVLFGRDYIINNGKWIINQKLIDKAVMDKNYKKVLVYKNPDEILKNVYRVLLSRGRQGMLLFIPDSKDLKETYNFFKSIGMKEIE